MRYFAAGTSLGVFTAAYAQDLERIPTRYRPAIEGTPTDATG